MENIANAQAFSVQQQLELQAYFFFVDWWCTSRWSQVLSPRGSQPSVSTAEGHTSHLSVSDEPENFSNHTISSHPASLWTGLLFCFYPPSKVPLPYCHSYVALNSSLGPWIYLDAALAATHPVSPPANVLLGRIPKCHYPTAQLTDPGWKFWNWFSSLTPTQPFSGCKLLKFCLSTETVRGWNRSCLRGTSLPQRPRKEPT